MSKEIEYDRESMARWIRTFFVEHKKRLSETGTYTTNSRHDNQKNWLKAADNCIRLQANPRDFVDAVFALAPLPGGPQANQLVGPSAEGWYREFMRGRGSRGTHASATSPLPDSSTMHDIKNEIVLAHILIEQITGSPSAWAGAKVLMDPFTSIRAHIRVAIAGKAGLVSVVKKFAADAQAYLCLRPACTACLKELGYEMEKYLHAANSVQ